MNWEDSFIYSCICNCSIHNEDHAEHCRIYNEGKKYQAEISFKAGFKYALEGAVANGAYDSIKNLGRQEVVNWFMTHGYSGGPIQYSDGVKARFDPDWNELQAKLKEWGIE